MIEFKRDMLQFFNDLLHFKETEPILILYNKDMKCVEYRQRGTIHRFFFLNDYFIHKPFKMGVLFPNDLDLLKYQLEKLAGDQMVTDRTILSIGDNTLNVYYPSKLSEFGESGPTWAYSFRFVQRTSRFWVWYAGFKVKAFRELVRSVKKAPKSHT